MHTADEQTSVLSVVLFEALTSPPAFRRIGTPHNAGMPYLCPRKWRVGVVESVPTLPHSDSTIGESTLTDAFGFFASYQHGKVTIAFGDFILVLPERYAHKLIIRGSRSPRLCLFHRTRPQAAQTARAILTRRTEERDKQFCTEHRELYGEALAATDLLALSWRRPDLVVEFPELLAKTECKYDRSHRPSLSSE